jgi:hypothetical protein
MSLGYLFKCTGQTQAGSAMSDFSFLGFTNDSDQLGSGDNGHGRRGSANDEFLDNSAAIAIEAWRSFEHSFKQPILAVAELADHTTHSKLAQGEWLSTPPPVEAQFGSAKYWAQQTGATLGTLPWFSLLHKVVGAGMEKAVGPGLLETLTTRQLHQYAMTESMITGFTYGAFLKPSRCSENRCLDNFWRERLLVGTTTSATFGISSYASSRITDAIGRPATSLEKIGTSFAASAFAGGFDAEVQSVRKYGRLADEKELAKGMYTYAVIGAGMTAVHEAFPSTRSETVKQRDSSYQADESGARQILAGFPEAVRRAASRGDAHATVLSTGGGISRPRTGEQAHPEALSASARIVYNRLEEAGLRPRVSETGGGHQITVPISQLQAGRHALIRQARIAAAEGFATP